MPYRGLENYFKGKFPGHIYVPNLLLGVRCFRKSEHAQCFGRKLEETKASKTEASKLTAVVPPYIKWEAMASDEEIKMGLLRFCGDT